MPKVSKFAIKVELGIRTDSGTVIFKWSQEIINYFYLSVADKPWTDTHWSRKKKSSSEMKIDYLSWHFQAYFPTFGATFYYLFNS